MAPLRSSLCLLALLSAPSEASRSLKARDPEAFVQKREARRKLGKQSPDEDAEDGYEYGSKESEVTQSNAGDFSVHQFLERDDARDGSVVDDEDQRTHMEREKALAADDHFNSEDTPDPNAFVQKARKASRKSLRRQSPEDEENSYEYGSKESEVTQSNAGDFSVHQFLERDDARDGSVVDDEDQRTHMEREKALAADDHFNSEDTPDPNAFVQMGRKARRQSPEDEDGETSYEYGGRESEVSQSDAGDFSVHQFLVHDDARDGSNIGDDDVKTAMAREKAAAADDHFNSEDTVDPNAFAQVSSRKFRQPRA